MWIVVICLTVLSEQEASESSPGQPVTQPLARLVLWFHHIKDFTKRKNIVGWAHELGVRGFSKPGFPGVIICEGRKPDIQASVFTYSLSLAALLQSNWISWN